MFIPPSKSLAPSPPFKSAAVSPASAPSVRSNITAMTSQLDAMMAQTHQILCTFGGSPTPQAATPQKLTVERESSCGAATEEERRRREQERLAKDNSAQKARAEEQTRREKERLAVEQAAAEKLKAEKLEAEKARALKLVAEQEEKRERQRLAAEQAAAAAAAKAEEERLAAEKAQDMILTAQAEARKRRWAAEEEARQKLVAAKAAVERADAEKLAAAKERALKLAALEEDRRRKERLAAEEAAAAAAAEKAEAERLAAESAKAMMLAAQEEARRRRLEAEEEARKQLAAEKAAAENARAEKLAAEKAEIARKAAAEEEARKRLAAEEAAAEKAKAEKLAAEKTEVARQAAEEESRKRLIAEKAAEKAKAEKLAAEKAEQAERQAAEDEIQETKQQGPAAEMVIETKVTSDATETKSENHAEDVEKLGDGEDSGAGSDRIMPSASVAAGPPSKDDATNKRKTSDVEATSDTLKRTKNAKSEDRADEYLIQTNDLDRANVPDSKMEDVQETCPQSAEAQDTADDDDDDEAETQSRLERGLALNERGHVLYQNGDRDGSLDLFLQAMAVYEEVLGSKHLDTTTCYNNISLVYYNKGDLGHKAKALDFALKCLAGRTEHLGPEHARTVSARKFVEVIRAEMMESAAPSLGVGERAKYWSGTKAKWLETTILAANTGPDGKVISYDIMGKHGVQAEKLQSLTVTGDDDDETASSKNADESHNSEPPAKLRKVSTPDSKKKGSKAKFEAGQEVKYFSGNLQMYMQTRVLSVRRSIKRGFIYELGCKKDVEESKICFV